MMFGKYGVYIVFSYAAALVLLIGLSWRLHVLFKRAKRDCLAIHSEHPDAPSS